MVSPVWLWQLLKKSPDPRQYDDDARMDGLGDSEMGRIPSANDAGSRAGRRRSVLSALDGPRQESPEPMNDDTRFNTVSGSAQYGDGVDMSREDTFADEDDEFEVKKILDFNS